MKREVKIGMFAVAMLLLAWAGIRFLSGLDIFSRNTEYYTLHWFGGAAWKSHDDSTHIANQFGVIKVIAAA